MDRPKMPESPLIVSHWEGPDSKSYTVYTEANMQAYGDQCVEFGRASVVVTEEMVERLAKHIAQVESHGSNTLDEALYHQSMWKRIVPEAREMLTAALGGGE